MGGLAASAVGAQLSSVTSAQAQPGRVPGTTNHYYVPATDKTVHWGYFSKLLKPQVEVSSGDYVTLETITHHANDDADRMVKGDPGVESIYHWDRNGKNVDRRGAGPMNPTLFGRGAGEGLGVHICTGPVAVRDAMPSDILEVRIVDVKPRPCANPLYKGKVFGSNAAAWWGFHYKLLETDPKPREVITIYEVDATGERNWAKGVYNFQWTPQTDPFGVVPQDHRLSRRARGPQDRAGAAQRWPASSTRCSRPRTSGCSTASAIPSTSPISGRRRSRTSTRNPRWTSPCRTPSGRRAISS